MQGRNVKKKKPTSGKGSASSGHGAMKGASDDPSSPHPSSPSPLAPAPVAPRSSQRRHPKQQQSAAAGGGSWLRQKWAVEEMSKTWLITPPLIMALLAMIVVAYERSVRIYNVIILKFDN